MESPINTPPGGARDPNREMAPEQPIFTLLLVRHEHVDYTQAENKGGDPALTAEGIGHAELLGQVLVGEGLIDPTRKTYLLSSPQGRTRDTLKGILRGAGMDEDAEIRAINQLRAGDKGENHQEFIDAAMEFVDEEGELNEVAWNRITEQQYGDDPLYTARPDVMETKENRKKRLYRSLEYLIRWQESQKSTEPVQQVIAVSHFEIIMHIIDDAFGIKSFDTHNLPNFGDYLSIRAFRTDSYDIIKFRVRFKDQEKEVLFDRNSRSVRGVE